MRDEIPAGDDARPPFTIAGCEDYPSYPGPILMAPRLSQHDMAFGESEIDQLWRDVAGTYQAEGIDTQDGQADIDVPRLHSRAELGAVLCQAIEILRGIAASIGLRDGCEGD